MSSESLSSEIQDGEEGKANPIDTHEEILAHLQRTRIDLASDQQKHRHSHINLGVDSTTSTFSLKKNQVPAPFKRRDLIKRTPQKTFQGTRSNAPLKGSNSYTATYESGSVSIEYNPSQSESPFPNPNLLR